MKKKIFLVVTLVCMTLTMVMTSFAAGWQKDNIGWRWQEDNGDYFAGGWAWLDGNHDGTAECYYFNESGYMLIDTITPDNYTVNGDGAWVENGVIQIKQVSSPDFYKLGDLDNLVYTNQWLNLKFEFPEGSQITTAKDLQETTEGSEILAFNAELPDQYASIQLSYVHVKLPDGLDEEASIAAFFNITERNLLANNNYQYKILGKGQVHIAGEKYEYMKMSINEGIFGQTLFCRIKDGYIVSILATHLVGDEADIVKVLGNATTVY